MYPTIEVTPERMRLRERNAERLSKCLRNTDTLKSYAIYERKMLSLQILNEEEVEISQSSMIVLAKKWNPSTWEISEPTEFVIKRNSTVLELGEILSEYYKIEVFFM